jgi:zinc/manganese transport system substrate-binding protein
MSLRNLLSQLAVTGVSAAALLSVACGQVGGGGLSGQEAKPVYPFDSGAVTVIGAENFYADVLHQIGGRKLKIYSFLSDPSADPHEYESNASDARAVADSRLVIENGLGYDAFMEKLLGASPSSDRVVIDVQQLVGAKDGQNPHLWYDPGVMPKVATAVAEALGRLDPAGAPTYEANLATFTASLQPIDDKVKSLRQRYSGAPIAFTEPVFGYMSDAIGLSVKSPEAFMKAVEEGNDPPSGAVAEEEDLLTRHQVKVLMYNSQTVTKITTQVKDLAVRSSVPVVGVSETAPAGKSFQDWQLGTLQELERALAS